MLKSQAILAEKYRQEAAYRKTLHGQLANKTLSIGVNVNAEKLSYKAFQKLYGKSIGVRAPGKFMQMLRYKAVSAGGHVYEFNTRWAALSQVCHCGEKHKKPLKQRIHSCTCGVEMQRDLYSAYLARFVEEDKLQATKASASWSGAELLLRAAWQQVTSQNNQLATGKPVLLR
ncbi:MAG: zinc ribbon domain-containing protein [Desulfitobacteriaceae bacterium]